MFFVWVFWCKSWDLFIVWLIHKIRAIGKQSNNRAIESTWYFYSVVRFPAAEEFVVIFDAYFLFNNAPNVLYMWKIWTAGRPIQHTDSSTIQSHAVVIAAVCGFELSCWNRHHLEGSISCSKTFIYLSAFTVPSKTCKLPIPYALMHPIPSKMLAVELNAGNMLEALAHRTLRRFWTMFTCGLIFAR